MSDHYCHSPFAYQSSASPATVTVGHVAMGGDNPDPGPVDAHIRHHGHRRLCQGDPGTGPRPAARSFASPPPPSRTPPISRTSRRNWRRPTATCPIVADIHFKPEAALEAAQWVEKVRINPGNYADTKKFARSASTPTRSMGRNWTASEESFRSRWSSIVQGARNSPCGSAPTTDRSERPHHEPLRRHVRSGMVESALEFATDRPGPRLSRARFSP
jgi:hypothetical protein